MATTSESPNVRRRRLSAEERAKLVAEAQANPERSAAELAELAAQFGVKLRWLQQLLRTAGTPRPRYPAPPPDARERERIVHLYRQDPNISAVARKVERSDKTVRLVLAENGLLGATRPGRATQR